MKPILVIICLFLLSFSSVSAISVNNVELADLGYNSFVVEANLDASGSAQVLYGKTGALGSSSNLVSSSSEHLLQVNNLESNTVYFYRVTGKDAQGNSYSSAISLTRTPKQTSSSTPSQPTNPDAKLLFASGFEGTTDVCKYASSETPFCTTDYRCGTDSTIKGIDGDYSWQEDVPGSITNMFFNDVIGGSPDCCASGCKATSLDQCHILDVVNTVGPDGTPTNALYYKRIKDCSTHSYSRLQLNFPADHTSSKEYDDFNPVYFRYWIRFQDNLYDTLSANNWRQIWEFYYQGNDWSNEFMLINDKGIPKWQLKGRFYGSDLTTQWIKHSTTNVTKDGEWFLLETYLKSSRSDGEIIVKINGDTIFDVSGPQYPTNRRVGQEPQTAAMLKLYTSADNQEQWMDNLEIWSDIPNK